MRPTVIFVLPFVVCKNRNVEGCLSNKKASIVLSFMCRFLCLASSVFIVCRAISCNLLGRIVGPILCCIHKALVPKGLCMSVPSSNLFGFIPLSLLHEPPPPSVILNYQNFYKSKQNLDQFLSDVFPKACPFTIISAA